jgi:hypothetical protein
VRVILEDPKYQDWFVSFKPGGSKPDGTWYSEQCDANLKSVCSDRYHNQEQSPGYPHGDGDCEAPGCDCGKVPVQIISARRRVRTVIGIFFRTPYWHNSYPYWRTGISTLTRISRTFIEHYPYSPWNYSYLRALIGIHSYN